MFKKAAVLVFSVFVLANLCGCFALFAGAGGAGTAVWLSGKLTQQFNASYDRTIKAAEKALKSLKLDITKESKEAKITQIKSKYTDGKDIWIDIRKVTDDSTRVDVRVGAVHPAEPAAKNILDRIQSYL